MSSNHQSSRNVYITCNNHFHLMVDMPTKPLTLQYEGLFDFDGMYATMTDWAKNYEFMWHEADYKHKVPNPFGAEQEFKWIMTKRVDTYTEYKIVIEAHTYEMSDIDVNVGGKKKTMTKARISVNMVGTVSTEKGNIFAKNRFMGAWLGKKYQLLFKREILAHWDVLNYRVYNLHAIIKTYFDLQSKKFAYKGYLGEN